MSADLDATLVTLLRALAPACNEDPDEIEQSWREATDEERAGLRDQLGAVLQPVIDLRAERDNLAAEVERLRGGDSDGPDESLLMAASDIDQLTAEVERLTRERAQMADENARVRQQRDELRPLLPTALLLIREALAGEPEPGGGMIGICAAIEGLREQRDRLRGGIAALADLEDARAKALFAARDKASDHHRRLRLEVEANARLDHADALRALLAPAPSTPDGAL